MKRSIAEKVEMICQLLGDSPVIDDEGNIVLDSQGRPEITPSFITKEEALKILSEEIK